MVNKDVYPIFGAYFSATIILITFLATITTTRSSNRTNTFINFANTFDEFMDRRQSLVELEPTTWRAEGAGPQGTGQHRAKALDYYGRFYGFQFSQYYAYKARMLDRILFTLWMRSRWREFKADPQHPDNQLHGVSFDDGWNHWLTHYHRGATDDFTALMTSLRVCQHEYRVPGLVIWHGPGPRPLSSARWFFHSALAELRNLRLGWQALLACAIFAVLILFGIAVMGSR
jgi:hypothetical protein